MKKYLLFISFLLLNFVVYAQPQKRVDETVNNIRYVTEVPHGALEIAEPGTDGSVFQYNTGCGDNLFWKIVGFRLLAVPQLINLVDDMELTQAKLPSGKGRYRTGDAALMALKEIIHNIPIEEFSGLKTADFAAPYYFYEKGLKDKKKRTALKEALLKWYADNRKNIIFKVGQGYGNCECAGKHPVGGAYNLKTK